MCSDTHPLISGLNSVISFLSYNRKFNHGSSRAGECDQINTRLSVCLLIHPKHVLPVSESPYGHKTAAQIPAITIRFQAGRQQKGGRAEDLCQMH